MIILRWSVWVPTPPLVFMLSHSVASFRRFFGDGARYVVFADDLEAVQRYRVGEFELRQLASDNCCFCDERTTWRKWAPAVRMDPSATEIRIDADIFALAPPTPLFDFASGASERLFLASQEEFSELWPYGNFGQRLRKDFAPINAGLIGQRPGGDLTSRLSEAYAWWSTNVRPDEIKYHDEQGAVVWALDEAIVRDDVQLLDPALCRIVCPLNDPPVQTIDGLMMMHATYPEHPAFWRFLPQIAAISGLPEKPPYQLPERPRADA